MDVEAAVTGVAVYYDPPSELAKAFEARTALTLFFAVVADGRLAGFLRGVAPIESTTSQYSVSRSLICFRITFIRASFFSSCSF